MKGRIAIAPAGSYPRTITFSRPKQAPKRKAKLSGKLSLTKRV